MSRVLNKVVVENAAIRLELSVLPIDYNPNKSRKKSRLWRMISFLVLFCKAIKAFNAKSYNAAQSTSSQENGNLMSASVTALSKTTSKKDIRVEGADDVTKPEKVAELSVEKPLDNVSDLDKESKEIFEKKVSSLSGFAVPLGSSKW